MIALKSVSLIAATSLVVALIAGCGESTQDKYLRMAQARGQIRAAEIAQEKAAEAVAQASPPAPPVEPVAAETPAVPAQNESPAATAPAPETAAAANSPSETAVSMVSSSGKRLDPQPDVIEPDASLPRRDQLLRFGRLGKQVAFVGSSQSIGVYDVATKRLQRQLYNPQLSPFSLSLSENGKLLAAGGIDGGMKVFPIESIEGLDKFQRNRLLREDTLPPRIAHDGPVTAIAVNDSVGIVATGGADGDVKLWSASDDDPVSLTGGSEDCVKLLSYQDDQLLFSAGAKGVSFWQVGKKETEAGDFSAGVFTQPPTTMVPGSDGKGLAVGDASGRVTLWTPENNELKRTSFAAHSTAIASVGFADGGKSMVTVARDGDIAKWNLPITEQRTFDIVESAGFIVSTPDGRNVGLPSSNGNFDLYSVADGKPVRRHSIGRRQLTGAAFSADGSVVALADESGRISFQDDAKRPLAYCDFASEAINQLVRSPDGTRFAFSTGSGKVGVASFPNVAGRTIGNGTGEFAAVTPSGSLMLLARGADLKLLAPDDGTVKRSATIVAASVASISVDDSLAVIGTSTGDLLVWPLLGPEQSPEIVASKLHKSAVVAVGMTRFGTVWSCDADGISKQTPLKKRSTVQTGKLTTPVVNVVSLNDGAVFALDDKNEVLRADRFGSELESIDRGQVKSMVSGGDHVALLSADARSVNVLRSSGDRVASVGLSGDRKFESVALAGNVMTMLMADGTATEVSLSHGDLNSRDLPGGEIRNLVVSADGRTMVFFDGSGDLYSSSTLGSGRKLVLPGQSNAQPIALSADGRFLVVATSGRTLCYEIGRSTPRLMGIFEASVVQPTAAAFSADAKRVIFALPSRDIVSCSISEASDVKKIGQTADVSTQMILDSSSKRLVMRAGNGGLTIINADDGSAAHESPTGKFTAMASSSDAVYLGTSDGVIFRLGEKDELPIALAGASLGGEAIEFLSVSSALVDAGPVAPLIAIVTASKKTALIEPTSGLTLIGASTSTDAKTLAIQLTGDRLNFVDQPGELKSLQVGHASLLAPTGSDLAELVVTADARYIVGRKKSGELIRWAQAGGRFTAAIPVAKLSNASDIFPSGIGSDVIAISENATRLVKYSADSDSVSASMDTGVTIQSILSGDRDGHLVIKTDKGVQVADFRRDANDIAREDFSKLADTGVVLNFAENGRTNWLAIGPDGGFIQVDQLTQRDSSGEFSLQTKPSKVAIAGGFLFAHSGDAIDVRREDGQSFTKITLPSGPMTEMAVHAATAGVATCDGTGGLAIRMGGQNETKTIRLPITDLKSIVWSDDGRHIAATNGQRILVVDGATAKVQSQTMITAKAAKLVQWRGDALWFLDASSRLTTVGLPQEVWAHDVGEKVSEIAFSSDGNSVVVATANGAIKRMDSVDGETQRDVTTGRTEVRCLTPIAGTDRVAFLAGNSDIVVMDADGTTAEFPSLSALGLRSLVASQDARWLFAANDSGQILSWDLTKRDQSPDSIPCELKCGKIMHAGGDRLIAIASDAPKVAIVSTSMRVNVVAQGGPRMTDSAVSPDGRFVAMTDDSAKVQLISLDKNVRRNLLDEGISYTKLAIHPTATHVAAIGNSQLGKQTSLAIWETVDLKQIAKVELGGKASMLCFSRDGGLLSVGFDDGHAEVFDASSAARLETFEAVPSLRQVAFNGDGSKLLLAQGDGVVRVESLKSLGRVHVSNSAIVSLGFHGGGKYLLCASMNGAMTLWNRAAFSAPQAAFDGLTAPIVHSSVSSDGRYVASVYDDAESSTLVWDLEASGGTATKIEAKLVIRSDVKSSSTAFTSDSKFLLIGGTDGVIRAWSLSEGREVARFRGHEGPVMDIAALADAGQFVSGGIDHSIRSWKFPSTLPQPGAEIPQGALADATDVQDLSPPEIDREVGKDDPFDAARQALIAGAGTTDILDLMKGEENVKEDVKESLTRVLSMEKNSKSDASDLSKERRRLAATQRKLDPSDQGRVMASFSDGFSNLTFVGSTNFQFGDDKQYRPVHLLFADRFLYAARTALADRQVQHDEDGNEIKIDEGDNGALLSWDYRYSGLQAHAWSVREMYLRELYPLSDSGGVFTVPQMMLFSQDGSSRQLASVASWAISQGGPSERQYLAVGTAGAQRSEEAILKIFDVADFSREKVSPYSQYRSFEGVVTAMAFANHSPTIAFSVRERAVHRLFIADAETLKLQKLEEVNHDEPWLNLADTSVGVSRNESAPPGPTSITFSPDDRSLIVHGKYTQASHKLATWQLTWSESGQLLSSKKGLKELTNESGPFFVESSSPAMRFVAKPGEESNFRRILVRVPEGFALVNISSQRAEQKINYLATQHGIPEYAVSRDGRWIVMGDDNGMAYIWDVLKGDRYSLTITDATEQRMKETDARLKDLRERPAHSGPIVGVAISEPDPGRDYPAFVATIGEENKLKVWEMFPILDPETGLRARN